MRMSASKGAAKPSTPRSSTASPTASSYVSGDFGEASTYKKVAEAIEGSSQPVFYLEIPPFLFGRVVKGLRDAGVTSNARIVVEKPFGHDLASARALAAELHQSVDESQIYRIDHFLGKMGISRTFT